MLKKELEDQNMSLRMEILDLHHEKKLILEQVRIYERVVSPNQTMTVALERTTEALAHVISDLKRRR